MKLNPESEGEDDKYIEDTEAEAEFYTVDETDSNLINITIPNTVYGYWEYVGSPDSNDYKNKNENYKLSCRLFKVRNSKGEYEVIYFHFTPSGTLNVSSVGSNNKLSNRNVPLPSGYNYNITVSSKITKIANYAFCEGSTLPISNNSTVNSDTEEIESGYVNVLDSGHILSVTFEENSNLNYIGSYAFWGCSKLKSISIPSGVISLNNSAFKRCYSLQEVIFDEISELNQIPQYAFAYCNNLSTIILPYSVDTICAYAFYNCKSLGEFRFPEYLKYIKNNTFENCTSIYTSKTDELRNLEFDDNIIYVGGNAFKGCGFDGKLTIGNGFTTISQSDTTVQDKKFSVNTIFGISEGQLTFTSLQIGNTTNSDALTIIKDNAFKNCISIKSVNITNSVSGTGASAFSGCTSLIAAVIPDTFTSISNNLFDGCIKLSDLSLPDNIETIGQYAFKNCSSLKEFKFPESLKYIKNNAFENCTSIYTSKTDELRNLEFDDNIIYVGGSAFKGCGFDGELIIGNGFTKVSSNDSVVDNDFSVNKVFGISSCSELLFTSLQIGNTTDSDALIVIKSSAFINCNSIKSVNITNSVSGAESSAFSGCTSLVTAIIPDTFTSISNNLFDGCIKLSDLSLPDNIETIDQYAFRNCGSLKEFKFPESLKYIKNNAFQNCTSMYTSKTDKLRNLEFNDNIIYVGSSAFKGCGFDGELIIGNGFTTISQSDTTIQDKKFSVNTIFGISEGQLTFTSLQIGHTVPDDEIKSDNSAYSTISIKNKAFFKSTKLETLTITNAVHNIGVFENNSNDSGAFQGCENLKGDLIIPEGVVLIGPKCFRHIGTLTDTSNNAAYRDQGTGEYFKLYIPSTVKIICRGAFESCTGFGSLEIAENENDIVPLRIYSYAFKYCRNLSGTLVIPSTVHEISAYYNTYSEGILYNVNDKGQQFAATSFDTIVFQNDIKINISNEPDIFKGIFTNTHKDNKSETNKYVKKIYYKKGTNVKDTIESVYNANKDILCLNVPEIKFIEYEDGETPWLENNDDD
jgi:hypothetical protein